MHVKKEKWTVKFAQTQLVSWACSLLSRDPEGGGVTRETGRHTAIKQLRIVILGFGTARQKRVLE
jgi:hypothetical protein